MAMSAPLGLGIDVGGTATRWCLADTSGTIVSRGSVGALSGHIYSDAQRAVALTGLSDLAAVVHRAGSPASIFAGITGLDAATPQANFYQAALATVFDIPADAVLIDNDMGLAYRAAYDLGTGILIYAGTGAVACHLTTTGEHIRSGGRGVIIDDAGSGHWIATQAARAVFRREDRSPGSGWTTILGQHLARGFGAATWEAAREAIYGGDRGQVAAMSRYVAAAANAGDVDALAILDSAGQELARLGHDLLQQLGPRTVILAGGTMHLHPAIPAAIQRALPATPPPRLRDLDPAHAGARLAAANLTQTGRVDTASGR